MEHSRRVWYPLFSMFVALIAMSRIDLSTCEPNYVVVFVNMVNLMDENAPIEVLEGEMMRYNKSIIVSNVTVDVKEDLCDEAVCSVQGYEKAPNGNYVQSNLNLGPLACKKLTENFIYRTMLPVSNLPEGFPIKKNVYSVINYILATTDLPEKVPGSENWCFEIKVLCGDKKMYHVRVCLKFDRSEWEKQQATKAGPPGAPGR